jgi:hypothetical protein
MGKDSSARSQQHGRPVEFQEVSLPFGEGTDIEELLRFNAHSLEGWSMCYRRDDQVSGVFETDESAVEKVVDAGSQKQAILSVQALFIRGVTPGFAVAGQEVTQITDSGDPATVFNPHDPLFK